MASQDAQNEPETEGEEAEALPPPPANKKKKLFIIAGAAVLALAGAGGGAMMFMGGGEGHGEEADEEAHEGGEVVESNFVDVSPMMINLRTPSGERRFVKLHFMIVPSSTRAEENIRERLPLIIDSYQPFLRELRPEDLSGSAAVYRLKEELILRAGEQVGAEAVSDILIQDLVQQ